MMLIKCLLILKDFYVLLLPDLSIHCLLKLLLIVKLPFYFYVLNLSLLLHSIHLKLSLLVLNLLSKHFSIVKHHMLLVLSRSLSKLIQSLLHRTLLRVFNLFLKLNFFLLWLQNLIEMLFKDHHLPFICSIKPIKIYFLLFSVSLNILSCFIQYKMLIVISFRVLVFMPA